MASGSKRQFFGSFTATGASKDITIVGFKPTRVVIKQDDGAEGSWTEAMAEGSAFKRIIAGTGSVVTTNGITPLTNGFRLGADAQLNVSGRIVYYECID